MEIARALTARRNKYGGDSTPTPALPARPSTFSTKRTPSTPISRRKISAPIALISTTNMLSYNAPDIRSSSSSSLSASDSDVSPSHSTSTSVSLDSPPRSPVGPNHLSIYFPPSGRLDSTSSQPSEDVPPVPQRATSHTRTSHMLAHKRSLKRKSPPNLISNTITESNLTQSSPSADSTGFDQPADQPKHPFRQELKEVDELVESFDLEEELVMREKGLLRFPAKAYLEEIEHEIDYLFGGVFADQLPVLGTGWI
ncbi:hypothetical protein GP486_008467 [Trichoglossum hirsutum]|uniref:Uncharacterized protein n=1 Tax=Trichoglossum hirsutum TaxID=265104 RepID=A0A9P8ICE9_9PEZI|nr:hypothetical protein GP486_008467 [Trichoglossum hirsutum]